VEASIGDSGALQDGSGSLSDLFTADRSVPTGGREELCSKDGRGRRAVVRNGYLPERAIQTGIGAVPVKVSKVRDRTSSEMQLRSELLPP